MGSNVQAFTKTGGVIPNRSTFDLSHSKVLNAGFGEIIPVFMHDVIPGDYFDMGMNMVIRMNPLVAPILHEINAKTYTFFVANRNIFPKPLYDPDSFEVIGHNDSEGLWENFITKGFFGTDTTTLPIWVPNAVDLTVNSLWDRMEMPMVQLTNDTAPVALVKRVYNFCLNEFFRDETLQPPRDLDDNTMGRANWEKDYFTSALPWTQRGDPAGLPITGLGDLVVPSPSYIGGQTSSPAAPNNYGGVTNLNNGQTGNLIVNPAPTGIALTGGVGTATIAGTFGDPLALDISKALNSLQVNVETTNINITDLRASIQLQNWLEINARGGVRYTEFIRNQYGASPRDDRLQRPEFIGGTKSPIVINEVLQTSSSDTTSPQGNMAGHGITADGTHIGKYHVKEHGWIMTLLVIRPKAVYTQGMPRKYRRRTVFDYPFPVFANLSEQGIENLELCATGVDSHDLGILGYQGRYDDLRFIPSMALGNMRVPEGTAGVSSYSYWNMARIFDTTNPPILNEDFIACNPDLRVFADTNDLPLIVYWGMNITATRPIPIQSIPGRMDHRT